MNKTGTTIYLVWALILVLAGSYAINKISDKSNPASVGSKLQNLNDVIENFDADIEVP